MRHPEFESAVARATGESLRTIQSRGFSLVEVHFGRSAYRVPSHRSGFAVRRSSQNIPVDRETGLDSEF
jgi:hypothetical protein